MPREELEGYAYDDLIKMWNRIWRVIQLGVTVYMLGLGAAQLQANPDAGTAKFMAHWHDLLPVAIGIMLILGGLWLLIPFGKASPRHYLATVLCHSVYAAITIASFFWAVTQGNPSTPAIVLHMVVLNGTLVILAFIALLVEDLLSKAIQ